MSKLNKIKEMLQTMLMQFSQLSTDKGLISWDGDGELPSVGDSIVIIDEEGNEVKAESGEYRADNGNIIVIEDGVVWIENNTIRHNTMKLAFHIFSSLI